MKQIDTVTGGGNSIADGIPATQASLTGVYEVALGPDGILFLAVGNRVRRVRPDGIIVTVAGNGQGCPTSTPCDDGLPATLARLVNVHSIALGPDGSFYFAEPHDVRRVGPNGIISTVAGTGKAGYAGDGGPATQAELSGAQGVAVGPDGSLYIADPANASARWWSDSRGLRSGRTDGGGG